MYISTPNCFKLDQIIKSFEVAYRSFVVEKVKTIFPNEHTFKLEIDQILTQIQPSPVINSHRYHSKVKAIQKKYEEHYSILNNCYLVFQSKKFDTKTDVPYVSTIIDYIEIFFNPHFEKSELLKGFTPIEFSSFSEKYHALRNNLSHPASSKINTHEAKEVFQFIKRIQLNIDDKYFWYVSKDAISNQINELTNSLTNIPIRVTNLDEINFSHQRKVICRENEIKELKNAFFGSPYRNAGSIVIYGYGGLGKTALVLEFIDQIIKESIDNENRFDFILFFTNKDELLDYSRTTGEIEIKPLKKQIKSFEELKSRIFTLIGIDAIENLEKHKGIIVIDNIETLTENGEKEKIMNFIAQSPRTVQYIITSREEESCEYRLNLKGFDLDNQGNDFLDRYVLENNLDVFLNNKDSELLIASKGNTLILILSLLRINDKLSNIDDIILELNSISSSNIETVSLFMYKNTFDRILKDLNSPNTLKILNVISLYNEPADIYSISKLSRVNNITEVERVCDRLASKLVLNKIEDYYELNEFANKFIFLKLRQNLIEERKLNTEISDYRFSRRQKIRLLEDKKKNNPRLKEIMDDWKARNNTDALAIYDVFNLHSLASKLKSITYQRERNDIKREINDRFAENESMSAHPYIKFQKARIFQMFLQEKFDDFGGFDFRSAIVNCYEDVILTINIDFKYIKSTRSYATVLWLYAQFLINQYSSHKDAVKYLDESAKIFEGLSIVNNDYKTILKTLKSSYLYLSRTTQNAQYSHAIREINEKLAQN